MTDNDRNERELWRAYLDGALSFEDWCDRANALYPLPPERAQTTPPLGLWDAIISKREREGK